MPRTMVREGTDADGLLAKVAKYIPAEITAAFIYGSGLIESNSLPNPVYWAYFLFCAIFAPLYFYGAALIEDKKPDLAQIVVSPIAVVIWVAAIGGPFKLFGWYNQAYGLLFLGPFTLIVPFADYAITKYLKIQKSARS